ncbi:hypothetical protein, partial [Burkholderia thailandensis]|uniref:hypothetical protein n=1 Tax=Burkholderia thailandensis TaxID=57975 RepID=UPI0021C885C4
AADRRRAVRATAGRLPRAPFVASVATDGRSCSTAREPVAIAAGDAPPEPARRRPIEAGRTGERRSRS